MTETLSYALWRAVYLPALLGGALGHAAVDEIAVSYPSPWWAPLQAVLAVAVVAAGVLAVVCQVREAAVEDRRR